MNRFILPVAVFLGLAALLYIGVRHSPGKNDMPSALIGKPAPAFELPVLGETSRKFSTHEFAGKPWVLNVWGTWCVACREEHEDLMKIAAQKRVPIVGLSYKDDDAAATDWLNQLGNPYTVVAVDKEGRTAINFGVYGAPETFLIDAAGVVQYRLAGPMTPEIWQREFLSRIGGGGPR